MEKLQEAKDQVNQWVFVCTVSILDFYSFQNRLIVCKGIRSVCICVCVCAV